MTDLRTALHEHAAEISPHPDLDDVFQRVDRRRRTTRGIGIAACVALVALAGAGVLAVRRDHVTDSPVAPVPVPIGAIKLDGFAVGNGPLSGGPLERHDSSAVDGPWTIVVRAPDGSLGFHSAVVTYPVAEPTALATPVTVGDVNGFSGSRLVVWPVGDGWARVRGDVGIADLIRIAEATEVVNGLPTITDLDGFTVNALQTSRATAVDELRYGSTDVGQGAVLGNGLTYTGVLTGGGFEDELFEVNARTGYMVQGHPAVVSSVNGGSGTLAWEPTPGVIAYVGYSGFSMNDRAIIGLLELANHTSPLTPEEWRAAGPQVSEQLNGPEPTVTASTSNGG
jgi:hypothetical protein